MERSIQMQGLLKNLLFTAEEIANGHFEDSESITGDLKQDAILANSVLRHIHHNAHIPHRERHFLGKWVKSFEGSAPHDDFMYALAELFIMGL